MRTSWLSAIACAAALALPLSCASVSTLTGAGTGAWPTLVSCNELLATPFQLSMYVITGGLWHAVVQADRPTSCLSDTCRLSGDASAGWTTHDCNAGGTLTVSAIGALAPGKVNVRYLAYPWGDLFIGNATVQST